MRSGLAAVYADKRTAATATKQRRLERIVRHYDVDFLAELLSGLP